MPDGWSSLQSITVTSFLLNSPKFWSCWDIAHAALLRHVAAVITLLCLLIPQSLDPLIDPDMSNKHEITTFTSQSKITYAGEKTVLLWLLYVLSFLEEKALKSKIGIINNFINDREWIGKPAQIQFKQLKERVMVLLMVGSGISAARSQNFCWLTKQGKVKNVKIKRWKNPICLCDPDEPRRHSFGNPVPMLPAIIQ